MTKAFRFTMAVLLCGASAVWAEDAQTVLSDIHKTNKMEIHMGRLAADKGSTPEVRAYGERLVKDHTAADKKVEELAQKQGIVLEAPGAIKKAMAKHEMSALMDKSGPDFDKAFAKEMVDDHQGDIAKLEKAQQSLGSTPTGALIADLLPTLREHLATAQQLAGPKS